MSDDDYTVTFHLEDGQSLSVRLARRRSELSPLPTTLIDDGASANWEEAVWQDSERRDATLVTLIANGLVRSSLASEANQLLPDLIAARLKHDIWTAEQALTWVEIMPDRHRRFEALKALAPILPAVHSARLYSALQSTAPERSASAAPFAGGWLNPDYYVSSALHLIIQRADAFDYSRTQALASVASFLPNPLQASAVREVLTLVLTNSCYRQRGSELVPLLPLLSLAQVRELIDQAETLPGERQLYFDNPKVELLAGLLPRLAELGHGEEALRRAQDLPYGRFETVECLVRLARYLPESLQAFVLGEAEKAALDIRGPWIRASVLIDIAERLAQTGNGVEAQRIAQLLDEPGMKLWAAARLLEYLPKDQAQISLMQLIASLNTAHWASTADREVNRCLAVTLARRGDIAAAFGFVDRVGREYEWWNAREALRPLADAFIQLGLGEQLLTHVLRWPNELARVEAVAYLLLHLPSDTARPILATLQPDEWREAVWVGRAEALAAFMPCVPSTERAGLLSTIVSQAQPLSERDFETTNVWLQVLTDLLEELPELPRETADAVTAEVLRTVSAPEAESWTWALLARLLARQNKPARHTTVQNIAVLLQVLTDPHDLNYAYLALGPVLTAAESAVLSAQIPSWPPTEQPREPVYDEASPMPPVNFDSTTIGSVLREVCSINHQEYATRAKQLRRLVPSWLALPLPERCALFQSAWRDLTTQRAGKEVNSDLTALAPVIASIVSTPAILQIVGLIVKVGQVFR